MINTNERRALICTPMKRDATLACQVLEGAGIACYVCNSFTQLITELQQGAGLILTMEEVLTPTNAAPLMQFLANQATWADLPILVLTATGGTSPWIEGAYERFGNLTLLERPVRAPTLISAARSALRARLRQYEIRLSDQRKDEFLAMLAHELRNPLAPISSAAQILKLIANNPDKVFHTSEIIERQVGHLTNLIDDLLDVARVTRGLIKLAKEPQDVRHLVAQAVEQVSPQIESKRQSLRVELPNEAAQVLGDSNRLVQVISNLLNNASKYTAVEGHIALQVELQDAEVSLSVSDNGIGISPKVLPSVFDLFAQAERTSDRSQGGLGLGLALVKSLMVSHGGRVQAFSDGLGKGSRFTCSLPRLSGEGSAGKSSVQLVVSKSVSTEDCDRLRIMVVDDNKDAADALTMYLDAAGHQLFVEYHATAALECARINAPQICILDIGLPDMDGNELVSRLRTMPETAKSTFIAVTGYSQMQDRKKSITSGFDHHFVKPVDVNKLINAIKNSDRAVGLAV